MGVADLHERLDSGPALILDGANGAELQDMGVPMHGEIWCATALATHPDSVRRLHEDYIHAGADIITTNSYASSPHNLEAAGLGGRAVELNAISVKLAREAIANAAPDRPVWVAGSMSSFGVYAVTRKGRPLLPFPVLEESYRRQAHALADAGADFLLLEMIREGEHGSALLRAALETGLPVWVGLSCSLSPDGEVKMLSEVEFRDPSDLDFLETLDSLMSIGGSLLAVMHSDVPHVGPALKAALSKWPGPLAAYANSGTSMYAKSGIVSGVPESELLDAVSPEVYLEYAREWLDLGARVVGGCCGIGRKHIRRLSEGLRAS